MIKEVSNPAVTALTAKERTTTRPQSLYVHYFFVVMASLFVAIAVTGFIPSYQAMRGGTLIIHWFVHIHGALMMTWLLVFFTQALLEARGNLKFHRRLGLFALALGVFVWISMGIVSLRVLIANHPPEDHFLFDLLLMEFYAMTVFGLFFTRGILARKKDTASHKRFLFLATLVLLQAAIDRIHWLPMFGMDYPYVFFIYLDTLIVPLIIYDFLTLRRIHRATLFGMAFIIVVQLTVSAVWGSTSWHRFWYKLTKPLMEETVNTKHHSSPTLTSVLQSEKTTYKKS
ncbi:MAG: hypothetical protein ABI675_11445 [Chitinophagaceae bacterium]